MQQYGNTESEKSALKQLTKEGPHQKTHSDNQPEIDVGKTRTEKRQLQTEPLLVNLSPRRPNL